MNSGFWTASWSVQGVSQPAVAKQNTDRSQMWDRVGIQLPQVPGHCSCAFSSSPYLDGRASSEAKDHNNFLTY